MTHTHTVIFLLSIKSLDNRVPNLVTVPINVIPSPFPLHSDGKVTMVVVYLTVLVSQPYMVVGQLPGQSPPLAGEGHHLLVVVVQFLQLLNSLSLSLV